MSQKREKMTVHEIRKTLVMSLVFALRMLGLFMVLPVLVIYGQKLPNASYFLIGLAAGSYGFAQALFQLPLGILSDYWGRKLVILLGLGFFVMGSLIAAFSPSLELIIVGRFIQGMGAIGAVVLATVTDITRPEVRTQAMAIIGMTIGGTFILALMLGPVIAGIGGLPAIFGLTAGLAMLAIVIVSLTPFPPHLIKPKVTSRLNLFTSHNGAVFTLHALLTGCFLVLPSRIEEVMNLEVPSLWRFYVPLLTLSVLISFPLTRFLDNQRVKASQYLRLNAFALGISILGILFSPASSLFISSTLIFFISFNILEASLPAMVSKEAPVYQKGTALGGYASAQFLGMFVGGALGGYVLQHFGIQGIALGSVGLALLGGLMLKPKASVIIDSSKELS